MGQFLLGSGFFTSHASFLGASLSRKSQFSFRFSTWLLMDIQTAQFLGIHAIVYVCVCFVILYYQRKLLNASPLGQSIIMLMIFVMSQFVLFLFLFIMGFEKKLSI